MNEHTRISDLLPLFISGALDGDERAAVEKHLADCLECQADLALWKTLAGEVVARDQVISAPLRLADRALLDLRAQEKEQAPTTPKSRPGAPSVLFPTALRRIWQLLRSQMPLVNREIWPASALVIALGYVIVLITDQSGVIYALAPLIAATCVSLIYGPEADPAYELALSTPTSPRQILLARLVLVFGYNLALVLVAFLGLVPVLAGHPTQPLLGTLVLAWLAPMTFLSASALVLSLAIGSQNAIALTYIAWIAQLLVGPLRSGLVLSGQAGAKVSPLFAELMTAYVSFWQFPALLLALSAVLFGAAVWLVGKQEKGLLPVA